MKKITFKLEPDAHRAFFLKCVIRGKNMTEILRQAVDQFIKSELPEQENTK